MVETCVVTWFFGENSVGRLTAREEEKRKTERNATELATGDKRRGHGLFTTQRAGTRAGKMANENLPIGQNTVQQQAADIHTDYTNDGMFGNNLLQVQLPSNRTTISHLISTSHVKKYTTNVLQTLLNQTFASLQNSAKDATKDMN